MGDVKAPIASLKYTYAKDGTLQNKEVNGKLEKYEYDLKGQLLAVNGEAPEKYEYDKAGNILKKQIGDKTTAFTYDCANQLVSSVTPEGATVKYAYDAAGRMVNETSGNAMRNYTYGWLDKVMEVKDSSGTMSSFAYNPDGQLAERKSASDTENFYWDGLALIKRDNTDYTVEPAVTGGNPIMADSKVLFNDLLGNTVGYKDDNGFNKIERNAFGQVESPNKDALDFFTGKPHVEGLGYNFFFRNYRADLGKWQTSDPLGFPDGWNNFAYVNNWTVFSFDKYGMMVDTPPNSNSSFNNFVNSVVAAAMSTERPDSSKTALAKAITRMVADNNTITVTQNNQCVPFASAGYWGLVSNNASIDINIDNYNYQGEASERWDGVSALLHELAEAAISRGYLENDSSNSRNANVEIYRKRIGK